MLAILRNIAVVLALGALLLVLGGCFGQSYFIFHPQRYRSGAEDDFHRPIVRLTYETKTGRSTAFYAPPLVHGAAGGTAPAHVWILFSGNASDALDYRHFLASFDEAPEGFLLVDYPGYGYNPGRPSARAINRSAALATDALATYLGVPPSALRRRMGALGVSLGAAAATDFVVAEPDIGRLIMVAPFTTLRAMARRIFGWPLSELASDQFDNVAHLDALAARRPRPFVALFHGDRDQVVPVAMGRELAAAHPGFVQYREIAGADHDDVLYLAIPQIRAAMRASYGVAPEGHITASSRAGPPAAPPTHAP
jgi:pimeloyl-ACP methyl ester carboxylesterase